MIAPHNQELLSLSNIIKKKQNICNLRSSSCLDTYQRVCYHFSEISLVYLYNAAVYIKITLG